MILDWVLWLFMWFFGLLISLAGKFIDFILLFDKLAGAPAVQTAWQFVRDALNFVFILALLAIAFATIAGIESYGIKQLLPRLLIAALLVNFSLAIAGAFLQVGNVLAQSSFRYLRDQNTTNACRAQTSARRVGSSLTCYLANSGGIRNVYTFGPSNMGRIFGLQLETFSRTDNQASLQNILAKLVALVFVIIFYFALVVLGILLAIRIAALIFLLILSPIPYVASVIPKVGELASKWWDSFLRYVFFYPAIVFFLSIAIVLAGQVGPDGTGGIAGQLVRGNALADLPQAGRAIFVSMFQLFIVSMFIIVATHVARQLGIAGAEGAVRLAKNLVKFSALATPLGAAKIAQVAVGRPAGRLAYEYGVKPAAAAAGTKMGGSLRGLRAAGRGLQRLYTKEPPTALQQATTQQQQIKNLNETQLQETMERGNVGAMLELLERGKLKTEKQFALAQKLVPRGTNVAEKLENEYGKKLPVTAVNPGNADLTQKKLEEALQPGGPGLSLTTRQQIVQTKGALDPEKIKRIRRAIAMLKDDEIRENDTQLRAAIQAATQQIQDKKAGDTNTEDLAVDLTPSKLIAFSRNLSKAGQDDLEKMVLEMQKKGLLSKAQQSAARKEEYLSPKTGTGPSPRPRRPGPPSP